MKDLKQYKKQGIILLLLCAVVLAAAFGYLHHHKTQEKAATVIDEDIAVTTTDIQQTLTAAGEVQTVKEETLLFSKNKTFKAMCVEVKDYVPAGGHIALYSDGTYLDADHSGVVSAVNPPRTGTKGDGVYAVTFLPDDQITICLTVPEDDIGRIAVGNEAKVLINAAPDQTYTGTITYISGSSNAAISDNNKTTTDDADTEKTDAEETPDDTADDTADEAANIDISDGDNATPTENNANYKAVVSLENDGSLRIGMSASCTILLAEKQGVLAVPVNAVHIDGDTRYVNVVKEDGSVSKTEVETGISDATYVEIVSGLTGDEKVRVESVTEEKTK